MDNPITLNKMRLRDIDNVLDIGSECGLSRWSFEGYESELKRGDSIQRVARVNAQIIGFVIMRLISMSNEAEIYNLAVKESFRKEGVGTRLLKSAIELCKSQVIWLEVRVTNQTAVGFYQKNGFIICGQRKSFYTDPTENAFLMKYHNTWQADTELKS